MLRVILLTIFAVMLSACSTLDSSKEHSITFYLNEKLSFEPEKKEKQSGPRSPFDTINDEDSVILRFIEIWHEKHLSEKDKNRIIERLNAWKQNPFIPGDEVTLSELSCGHYTVASFIIKEDNSVDDYWELYLDYPQCCKMKTIILTHKVIKGDIFNKVLVTLRTNIIYDFDMWDFFVEKSGQKVEY